MIISLSYPAQQYPQLHAYGAADAHRPMMRESMPRFFFRAGGGPPK